MARPAYHLRPATPADAAAILQLHAESVHLLCAADYTPEQIHAWVGLIPKPDWLQTKFIIGVRVIVAESDQGLLGFAERWNEEIFAVYVHPLHIRRGIGSALLDELERTALEQGMTNLRLDASMNAEAFYNARGYASIEAGTHAFADGTVIPCMSGMK